MGMVMADMFVPKSLVCKRLPARPCGPGWAFGRRWQELQRVILQSFPKYASDILEIPVLIRNNPNKSQQFEEIGDYTRSRHV